MGPVPWRPAAAMLDDGRPTGDARVMPRRSSKQQALDAIGALPASASWDDILYGLYVRQKVERGLVAADAGEVVPHAVVARRFLRPR